MRYGLEAHDGGLGRDVTGFPIQSSVLDEEALLRRVVGEYRIPRATGCRFFCRGDSDIYRVTTAGEEFYLKVYRPPQSAAASEAEARFVADLASRGVPVVRAVPRVDGAYASEVEAPEGRRPVLMFERAPPDGIATDSAGCCRKLGRAVAELHEVADALEPADELSTHDCDSIVNGLLPFARRLIPEDDFRFLESLMGRIRDRLGSFPTDPPEFGPCHCDLVPSNIRQAEDGRITFFDFGNVSRTWRAWDLGVLHLSLRENEKGWDALLEGYAEVRALPMKFEEAQPAFLLLRRVAWLAGVLASCPLRLGVQNFGSQFVNECLAGIRKLSEEVPWFTD